MLAGPLHSVDWDRNRCFQVANSLPTAYVALFTVSSPSLWFHCQEEERKSPGLTETHTGQNSSAVPHKWPFCFQMWTHHLTLPISALQWWAIQGNILHTHLSLKHHQSPGCLKSESSWTWDVGIGKKYRAALSPERHVSHHGLAFQHLAVLPLWLKIILIHRVQER